MCSKCVPDWPPKALSASYKNLYWSSLVFLPNKVYFQNIQYLSTFIIVMVITTESYCQKVYLGASKINLQIKYTSHLRYTCKTTDTLTCFKFVVFALI